MILGIIGAVLGFLIIGIVPAVLAVIFGIIGLRRAKRGAATNRGQAMTGLILGIVGIILGAAVAAIGVTAVVHRYQDCEKKYDTNSSSFNHCLRGDSGY
jgi:uncharacterized membrane protein